MKIVIEQFIPECCWLPGLVDYFLSPNQRDHEIYAVVAKELVHLIWLPGAYRSYLKIDNVRQISFLSPKIDGIPCLGILLWDGFVYEVDIPISCPFTLPSWNIKSLSFPSKISFINDKILFGEDGIVYNWNSSFDLKKYSLMEGEKIINYSSTIILTNHGRIINSLTEKILLNDFILMPGPIIPFKTFTLIVKMNNIYCYKEDILTLLGSIGGNDCIVGILPCGQNYNILCLDGRMVEVEIIGNGEYFNIVKDHHYGDGGGDGGGNSNSNSNSIIIFSSLKEDGNSILLEIDRKRFINKQSISKAYLNIFTQ